MSEELRKALESGELTPQQLRELVEIEATELGLTVEQAEEAAAKRSLPRNAIGTDLGFLLKLMQGSSVAA